MNEGTRTPGSRFRPPGCGIPGARRFRPFAGTLPGTSMPVAALNPEPEGVARMAGLKAPAPAEPGRTCRFTCVASGATSPAWPSTETSAPAAPSPGDGASAAARPCICFIMLLRFAFSGSLP
eukprot:scaffold27024_cov63-Phaeocystis_antarctica.AAC.2